MENDSDFDFVQRQEKDTEAHQDIVEDNFDIDDGYATKLAVINGEEMPSQSEIEESQSTTKTTDEREELLEQKWKTPDQSSFSIVQNMLERGLTAKEILQSLLGSDCKVPDDITEGSALRLLIQFVGERRFRNRLPQYHDFKHAVELFKSSRGIYATLKQTFPELPHPTAMFDINYFKHDPHPFFSFAKEIFPGAFKPSVSHMFIKFLEENGKLLRNYTQNIDTLERVAGITRYVECHGSFGSATCLQCNCKYTCDEIREDIYAQKVARCKNCDGGLIKPDIVFFGENLPEHFHLQMAEDKQLVDLVVVTGSSLQVQPVSLIPFNIDDNVPQILINKEDLSAYNADVKLIGDCDEIVVALCLAMGGNFKELMLKELKSRSSSLLTKLEPLLLENSDCIYPSVITIEEIKKQINEDSQRSESDEQLNDQIKEPPAKRMKPCEDLGEELPLALKKNDLNPIDELRRMYEANFVHVPSKFTGHMYAKFPVNLNIFNGADFYYNIDQQSFGTLPRNQEVKSTMIDFEEDDQNFAPSSNDSSQCCESNPELRRPDFEPDVPVQRWYAASCPDFDSSRSNSPCSNL